MKKPSMKRVIAAAVGVLSMTAGRAWGGNDAYFVTYNHHIAKGELELMIMNDVTAPSKFRREDDGQHTYVSNMIELEYGVTRQFATELMLEAFEEPATGESKFTGFRWENRYRLFPHTVPLNPVLYVEYEDLDPATRYKMEVSGWIRPPYADKGGEPDRERILESRLILSQDFGPVNAAFDWINESDVNDSGFTAFGYAMGIRWDLNRGHHDAAEPGHADHHQGRSRRPTLGLELYGALGDTERFGLTPKRQEHYLQPVIMLHLADRVMLHIGTAIGLSKASDDLVRTALAIEF